MPAGLRATGPVAGLNAGRAADGLRPCPGLTEPSRPYAAPAVVLAEALPVVELMLAVDNVLVTLLPAELVALAVGLTTVTVLPVEDKVPVLLVVTAEALVDVPEVAIGNCCSMTST